MKIQKKAGFLRWVKGFMLKHIPGMMTCQEFEDFVQDYVDGKLSADQQSLFEWHIRLCRECRQYLQAYQRTLEISRAVFPAPDAPVPDDVPEDLIKAILNARNK